VAPLPPAPTIREQGERPIEVPKSGGTSEELEPPPKKSGGWLWFGGGPRYNYLTQKLRDQINKAGVRKARWRYIVVHNSGTRQGNARAFENYHRRVRKMPNGLAYHFVIGNGTSSGDGEIEIGNRWHGQLQGGHVHSDYLNYISIGICLVGDFNRDKPTRKQLESLEELIKYLRLRVGKIEGRATIVRAHRAINPPQWPTDCPGDRFPYGFLKDRFE
jgi:hypothetical protein